MEHADTHYAHLSDLPQVAADLLAFAGEERVLLFRGEMGAGKTTLIAALCRHLGVEDAVSSPTFAIVQEYQTATEAPVYHFDFYRINSLAEAADLDLDAYFYSGDWCLAEWPERVGALLPERHVNVWLDAPTTDQRRIRLQHS